MEVNPAGVRPGTAGAEARKLASAAADFEALMLAELLKRTEEAEGGGDAVSEFAREQLAQALARGGGLGLGRLITGWLERPR